MTDASSYKPMPAGAPDYVIDQGWDSYTAADHAIWATLYRRQSAMLSGRACQPFLDGLAALGMSSDRIPDFRRLNDLLGPRTGWQVVAVPGLVPEAVFFEHMANRRFVATNWIRRPEQLDYLEEPDIFHDVFGHVPLLANPVFANYLAAYGRGGLKALRLGALDMLARLYWYTVEFGLMTTDDGLRIYGAGIVSSKGESLYSLDSAVPNRLGFDLERILRTRYRIDDFQETYFVIDGFDQLFAATEPDFTPIYEKIAVLPELAPGDVLDTDLALHRGDAAR